MGDWYVIANIPTFSERDAWNAVESYRLRTDGRIATTFTYNKGGYDGPRKTLTPMGFVRDGKSNAVWGMQFIWPMKAEYVITWLDDDYSQTIIARNKRDYVWVLARTQTISAADYNALTERIRLLATIFPSCAPCRSKVRQSPTSKNSRDVTLLRLSELR
jgi:apolipoprotein D and lipocalin family protein